MFNLKNKLLIMDKKAIIKKLRELSVNMGVSLPNGIDFNLDGGVLRLKVSGKGVVANMQTDSSAFEGWAVCIKSWMKEVENVVIGWERPVYSIDPKEKNRQEKHYYRFLLRAAFFDENYPWVSIEGKNKSEIDEVKGKIPLLVVNYPKTKSKQTAKNGEAKLERKLVERFSNLRHQLPVGLFINGDISVANTFTPRGASQIDIWELDNGNLKIYELKDRGNKHVGIISELMYYANVMRLLVEGKINYPEEFKNEKRDYRGEKVLYKAVVEKEIKKVKAQFWTFGFHPLINGCLADVLKIMNQSEAGVNVEYGVREMPEDLLENEC